MHDEQDRIPPPAKRQVSNIELRRAVMRILIRANGAMLVGEIVRRLEDVDHVDVAAARVATPSQRVSNLLGWQVRRGRVKRISHGLYVAVPESIPRTTLWRIEHWDDLGWGGRRSAVSAISQRRRPGGGGRGSRRATSPHTRT